MIYKFFELTNKIPKFLKKLIPKFLRRKINKKFDFINFGSSIRYFENYEDVLNKVSKIGNNIFLLELHYLKQKMKNITKI